MEALGIVGSAASILQLIDTAAKLSIQLYSFASTIGGAEEEINAVALEISLFANTLDQLRTLFEKEGVQYSAGVLQNTENVIRSCRDLFTRYEMLLSDLANPSDDRNIASTSIILSKTGRVKWAFKQKRVEVLRRRLAALQTNLLAMLHTLTLSELQSLRSLASEQLRRREEQILRSYIMANRASISSLEEAEKNEALAADESYLIQSQDMTTGHSDLDDTGMLRNQTKRDSVWLSEAMPYISSPSGQLPSEGSDPSKDKSALLGKSLPKVEDFVARYSVHMESDERQASQSESRPRIPENLPESQILLAVRLAQETSYGQDIEQQVLARPFNSLERERRAIQTQDKRRFAIHEFIPITIEETPSNSALEPKAKDFGRKSPQTTSLNESWQEIPDARNFEEVLAALRDRPYQDFFDDVSMAEQWFRVLTSDERLDSLHSCLNHFGPQSVYVLSLMLWDCRNSRELSHFDISTFQTIEKGKVRASSNENFKAKLQSFTNWFIVLDDVEQMVALAVLLRQASPFQVAFLCCGKAP